MLPRFRSRCVGLALYVLVKIQVENTYNDSDFVFEKGTVGWRDAVGCTSGGRGFEPHQRPLLFH